LFRRKPKVVKLSTDSGMAFFRLKDIVLAMFSGGEKVTLFVKGCSAPLNIVMTDDVAYGNLKAEVEEALGRSR